MSHEQRLNNLGIPTDLPEDEERRLVEAKAREISAALAAAEAEYWRNLEAEPERSADCHATPPKPGGAAKRRP